MDRKPKKIKLKNGTVVLLKENHTLPIVAVTACFLGGLLAENKTNNGISHLWAQCITKGTKKRNALKMAEEVENMAGQLDAFGGKNSFGLRLEVLSEYLHNGLDLFFETLLEPAFDAKEFAKEKKLTLEAIKNQEDNLSSLAFHQFQKILFRNHPYGMRVLGEKDSLKRLTTKHLKGWHKKMAVSKNMVLSIVGDFSSQEVLTLLGKKSAGLPNKSFAVKQAKKVSKPSEIKKVETFKKKEQAHVVLGFLGPSFKGPDYHPMIVLNNILSGMGGRLFVELRDKLSLAYTITSVFQPGLEPGFFAAYIGTEPSKVPTALKAMKEELKKITGMLVAEEELNRTKNHLVGTYELDLQKNSGLAQMFAFDELYGVGCEEVFRYPEKILKVTREDILRVAKKYIDLGAYVISVVQPK